MRQRGSVGVKDCAGGAFRRSEVSSRISTSGWSGSESSALSAALKASAFVNAALSVLTMLPVGAWPGSTIHDDPRGRIDVGVARERAELARDRSVPGRAQRSGERRSELDMAAREVDHDLDLRREDRVRERRAGAQPKRSLSHGTAVPSTVSVEQPWRVRPRALRRADALRRAASSSRR